MANSELLSRLEAVVEEWALRTSMEQVRRFARNPARSADEFSSKRAEAEGQFGELLALPEESRLSWLEERSWQEEGVLLGVSLLDHAEKASPESRLHFARLAARASGRAEIGNNRALRLLLGDNLGRAGYLEVRALRALGRLVEARELFAELEDSFEGRDSVAGALLTLAAERRLTAGLLAIDEYRLPAAQAHFTATRRCFRVASCEDCEAELLSGQTMLALLRNDPLSAVDRLTRAPAFESRNLRSGTQWLLARAALRTRRPSLARAPLAVLLAAHKAAEERVFCALQLETLGAAARLLESRPIVALEVLAGVGRRACAGGLLLTALTAALTAARAQLALHRRDRAREALASGVLSDFGDVPHTAAIQATLIEVSERCKAGDLDPAFLDRLEVWLILVEQSPGVSLPPQA